MVVNIKIGTRGSKLAVWQANWVKAALKAKHPLLAAELVTIKTKGDKILDTPLARIGGKGLFIKEIEDALLDGRIDLAVHSMKDMPAIIPDGLRIGAIPERETPKDVLISKKGLLTELETGACIGTSSVRRAAQLLHTRPDIVISPLRGNLDTRIRKLATEDIDAIVLAAAGIRRLGFVHKITEYLDESVMLPAVGQGALCIEIKEDDAEVGSIVASLDHLETRKVVMAERAFLNRLGGSCQVPIAALGKIDKNRFSICGLVADTDGATVIRNTLSGPVERAGEIGVELAESLLAKGAKEILVKLQDNTHGNY